MKRFALIIAVTFLLMTLFTLTCLHAQAPTTNNPASDLERPINKCEQQVAGWEREAHIEITLVIAVIVFGVLVSALQGSSRTWAKTATILLGVATAILTGVNSRVFTADDRTLRRAAFEGNGVISQLWVMVDTAKDEHLTEQDRLNVKGDYLKKLLEFQAVGERLNGTATTTADAKKENSGLEILTRVYAQSVTALPVWVQKVPSDNVSLYFVGKGYDASLSNAKQNSTNDALNNAVQALRPHAPTASEADLMALVKASAIVQDVAFVHDEKTGNYIYYTLLRISKEIGNVGLTSLPANNAQFSPMKFRGKGWQPSDLTSNPTSGLFALDSHGGISRLVVDQASPRIETLFRLKAVDAGYGLSASAESVFVSANSKFGCTIFKYDLTSKAVSSSLAAVNERCVGIAADRAGGFYVTIPKREEIRHWNRWDDPSPHVWDLDIDSPGILAFDDIGHRLIVADASGKAYAISITDGKKQLLATNLGAVTSIATSRSHIILASGKKVLFLDRFNGHGENPPAGLQSLTGGNIVGVAVDADDGLWFADYEEKLVEGPFPL